MSEPAPDECRKLTAERDALAAQVRDLQAELARQRRFVRLCAAIFPALDGARALHGELWEQEKHRPLLP